MRFVERVISAVGVQQELKNYNHESRVALNFFGEFKYFQLLLLFRAWEQMICLVMKRNSEAGVSYTNISVW